ncbi:hypothetical protein V6Z11_1Z133300 [Gossypium hirsutum]
MDAGGNKFGGGPRELSGVVDLISRYKLLPHHDFFCKRPLPLSIADTHYLHIDTNARIQPFDFDILKEAFQLRETTPVELPPGCLLLLGNQRVRLKIKRKHKSTKIEKEKDKERKKHKHCHKDKDRSKDKDKEKKKDRRASWFWC